MACPGHRCVGHPLRVARRPAPALIRPGAPAVRAEGSRCQLMRRLRHRVPAAVLLSLASVCASCGGSSSSALPPPPVADFSLSLSSNSISITQGAASPALNISINSVNRFTGAVQVALNALPAGITSNLASPLSVAAGARTSVVFGASANPATGNFMASVQGTSGTLSHSASLSVAIQSAVNPALPRTAYARTDSASAADDPLGEPHHRHIAYDPANKRVFIANRSLNRVDVFSTHQAVSQRANFHCRPHQRRSVRRRHNCLDWDRTRADCRGRHVLLANQESLLAGGTRSFAGHDLQPPR